MSHLHFPSAHLASGKPYIYRNRDMKTAGTVTLWTPTENVIPIVIIFRVVAASTVTLAPTLSIGTNAATYNNIVAATALTGLDAVNEQWPILITTLTTSVASGTAIVLNVTAAATATTLNCDIWLVGVRD